MLRKFRKYDSLVGHREMSVARPGFGQLGLAWLGFAWLCVFSYARPAVRQPTEFGCLGCGLAWLGLLAPFC